MCTYILLARRNVLHVQIIQDMYNIKFLNAEEMTSTYRFTSYHCQQFYGDVLKCNVEFISAHYQT